jgi:hypothetical protein
MPVKHARLAHTQTAVLLLLHWHAQSVQQAFFRSHGEHLSTALAWLALLELLRPSQAQIPALLASHVLWDHTLAWMGVSDVCCVSRDSQQSCLDTKSFY